MFERLLVIFDVDFNVTIELRELRKAMRLSFFFRTFDREPFFSWTLLQTYIPYKKSFEDTMFILLFLFSSQIFSNKETYNADPEF